MLAFMPLYDPLSALFPGLDNYWLALLIPLVIAICIVYKGTRIRDIKDLPKAATIMTIQVLLVMTLAAFVIYGVYIGITRLRM
jgi:hypothetical protein